MAKAPIESRRFDQPTPPMTAKILIMEPPVQVQARGVDRIISPVGHTRDEFFLNGPQASDDFLVEHASQQRPEREAL
jgi:virulence-associated protein VagC